MKKGQLALQKPTRDRVWFSWPCLWRKTRGLLDGVPEAPSVTKSEERKKREKRVLIKMRPGQWRTYSLTWKEKPRGEGIPEFSGGVSRPSHNRDIASGLRSDIGKFREYGLKTWECEILRQPLWGHICAKHCAKSLQTWFQFIFTPVLQGKHSDEGAGA